MCRTSWSIKHSARNYIRHDKWSLATTRNASHALCVRGSSQLLYCTPATTTKFLPAQSLYIYIKCSVAQTTQVSRAECARQVNFEYLKLLDHLLSDQCGGASTKRITRELVERITLAHTCASVVHYIYTWYTLSKWDIRLAVYARATLPYAKRAALNARALVNVR